MMLCNVYLQQNTKTNKHHVYQLSRRKFGHIHLKQQTMGLFLRVLPKNSRPTNTFYQVEIRLSFCVIYTEVLYIIKQLLPLSTKSGK